MDVDEGTTSRVPCPGNGEDASEGTDRKLFDARMYFHLEWLQLRCARLHLAMRMISRTTRSFAIVHSDKRIKYKVGSQSPKESVFLCAVEKEGLCLR